MSMTSALSAYLPQDRRRALALGQTLPDRTDGAALFADISGFTPLTEAFAQTLGPRRGAEALTHQLDAVYDALIAEVERYGGSVISFAGDAITCWFDESLVLGPSSVASADTPDMLDKGQGTNDNGQRTALRAVACAMALQQAMRQFAAIPLPDGATIALALKVAIASGPIRRFAVGDPNIQRVDALAGPTVARTAAAEHLARPGDVLVDAPTAALLHESLRLAEWREDPQTHERFGVVGAFTASGDSATPMPDDGSPAPELWREWLLPAVYARERAGQDALLTEFRPAVAFFLRFVGIDYEHEEAGAQLDAFIRQIQGILARYEGVLLQLTIGDKGSYLYAAFGALTTHEDDARRAVKAAFDLKRAAETLDFLTSVQIGSSRGTMRTGAYGGATRRTYGVLGDDVNLAARLMVQAAPGEILLSGRMHQAVAADFTFEPRPPIPLKGKAEPLPVFAVIGAQQRRAIRLQEPTYALPMVGRQAPLHTITAKMDLVLQGQGQMVGIVAEAGLGKSRLVAEVIRAARRNGFVGYGGACQSDGMNTPYLVWKPIWGAFFDVDPELSLRKQLRHLEGEIEDRAPARLAALPLLGAVLGLPIPDNDFTRTLEPQTRKSALHALLEDCLKAEAREEPLLLVFEDLHWIDALSHDLLEELARATTNLPILFLLAYRPPQLQRLQAPRLEALTHFTKIGLSELDAAECEQAIRAKLAQLYPARGGSVPPALVEKLVARAQGNPFYLEELLNYLHDRGLDPLDPAALHRIDLPDSLHALILSRIDQLSEHEKTTVRVASVIGRLFRAAWLPGYYPTLGELAQVKADLDELDRLEITPLDTPEPELAYLFRHIVTHEVAYESLPYATRAQLHGQLAQFIEAQGANKYLDLLAYHYSLSENSAKQHEYLRKAGEAAQAAYANEAARDYYAQLLTLLTEPNDRIDIGLKQGTVLELLGKRDEAEAVYRTALLTAEQAHSTAAVARCQKALGFLLFERGKLDAALEWLERARAGWATLADKHGLSQVLAKIGFVYRQKGNHEAAKQHVNESLALAREIGDRPGLAAALQMLGSQVGNEGDYTAARTLYEESLTLRRALDDKPGVAETLGSLGYLASEQGDYAAARALYEEGLALEREIGDKQGVAVSLGGLGALAMMQGNSEAAQALTEQWLALSREIGDTWQMGLSFMHLGIIAQHHEDFGTARVLFEQSLAIGRELGAMPFIGTALENLGNAALDQNDYTTARTSYAESLQVSQGWGSKLSIAYALSGLAGVAVGLGDAARAASLAAVVNKVFTEMGVNMDTVERRIYDHTLASAKAALGEAMFAQAWDEGKRMTLEQAIGFALGPAPEITPD